MSQGTALQKHSASNGRTYVFKQAKAAHVSRINSVKLESVAANLDGLAVLVHAVRGHSLVMQSIYVQSSICIMSAIRCNAHAHI